MYALQVLDSNSVSHLNIDFTSSFFGFLMYVNCFLMYVNNLYNVYFHFIYFLNFSFIYFKALLFNVKKNYYYFTFPTQLTLSFVLFFVFSTSTMIYTGVAQLYLFYLGAQYFLGLWSDFFYLLGSSLRHFVINSLFLHDYLSTFLLLLLLHICYTFKLHFICILNFFL